MTATEYLPWPREAARPPAESSADMTIAPSNIALDLHGDPAVARLHVFSDGNHHMALAETVAAFLDPYPEAQDVFYLTTPPRISIEAMRSGVIRLGNLSVSSAAHVVIGPEGPLAQHAAEGRITGHVPFMRSTGNVILRRRGDPKGVRGLRDIFRDDVRLAISNPVTEAASFAVYAEDIVGIGSADSAPEATMAWLTGAHVVKSRMIHHREIPELLAADAADASIVYRHLGLRYARVFPDIFETSAIIDPGNVTVYHAGLAGDAGAFGAAFLSFLQSDIVADIYRSHGLAALGDAVSI